MAKSRFILVKCRKCRNEQIIYNKVASVVKCLRCKSELANPTGGEAHIKTRILRVFS